jgi:hypothetical protein
MREKGCIMMIYRVVSGSQVGGTFKGGESEEGAFDDGGSWRRWGDI